MPESEPSVQPGKHGVECVVLPVKAGARPSGKPPVRIFLGTEAAQYRAERIFLWSIERVRDPGRVYEIHRMCDLPGFRRLGWNTGFTNYRFAIPELAGSTGRAIYNDVDQIYLRDPGELFDLPLDGHGYLAVSETDTSVMLIDCARMARIWPLAHAQKRRKYGLIQAALDEPGCYGHLDGAWNARDEEYAAGESKLLHYTTLHKQPWRPFPERFYYQPNTKGDLWHGLEREADAAGFHLFGPARPSRRLRSTIHALRRRVVRRRPEIEQAAGELAQRSEAESVLEVCATRTPEHPGAVPPRDRVALDELLAPGESRPSHDGVIFTEGLDRIPPEDLPWVVERLFSRARKFVLVAASCEPPPVGRRLGRSPIGTVQRPEWWAWALRSASVRHPDVHWQLVTTVGEPLESGHLHVRSGGRWLVEEPPRVWVLTDHKPGHTTQCIGLADELGWPYEIIDLSFRPLAEAPLQLLGPTLLGLTRASAERVKPPWPDLVIATGRRSAPVAGWIRKRSAGRARTVVMGRMGSSLSDEFDLAVAPAFSGLYPDPRRMDTVLPISRVRESALESARARWKSRLERGREPRIALLVGGGSPEHRLTREVARELGHRVADMARRAGGSVFVTTSRRTKPAAADAMEEALGNVAVHFHRWAADQSPDENPYMGYLALADVLVATGDSASMLSEACATGKPLYVLPLPRSSSGLRGLGRRIGRGIARAIARRAMARPTNRRGIERPQRGLEWLCARILADGWIHPSAEIETLHKSLFDNDLARPFDGGCELRPHRPVGEAEAVAARVREMLGTPEPKDEI